MSDSKGTVSAKAADGNERKTGIDDDETIYHVVINLEEQYSIWPTYRGQPPAGWRAVGVSGNKATCLAHINEVWTDMRPLSLRLRMAEAARAPAAPATEAAHANLEEESVVSFLAEGEHPIEATLRPARTAAALKAALDRGYVHLKFTDTRGGTELGVQLDLEHSRFDHADFTAGAGSVHLEGTLELDGVELRCLADLDLARLAGSGQLKVADGSVQL